MPNSRQNSESFEIMISNFEDIILARQKVKFLMGEMCFSLLAQTRIVTAVSELARNMVTHAGQGKMTLFQVDGKRKTRGLKCIFEDKGPGIQNIDEAMQEGFSTANSLGLGLGGAKKLCNEFKIESVPGKGTSISIIEWL
ncbi:anti-sigma regulatory factor [Desulfobacterales bacterium HSG16]|nr:anti-sigma regulatory factor [Desulfobacterales bacterium HSG16]